jgi:hypothetical protein
VDELIYETIPRPQRTELVFWTDGSYQTKLGGVFGPVLSIKIQLAANLSLSPSPFPLSLRITKRITKTVLERLPGFGFCICIGG